MQYLLSCYPLTSRANVVEEGVVILCPYQRAGKDNSVEGHIVLGHELVQLHLPRVLPPLFPLICVASCDRQVAGGWGEGESSLGNCKSFLRSPKSESSRVQEVGWLENSQEKI